MNLDFNIGDAFLNDSWNRTDHHEEHDEDTLKVLKKYEKNKETIDVAHDKTLLDIDRIALLIEKSESADLHNQFELLKHRCLLYLEKVEEYET